MTFSPVETLSPSEVEELQETPTGAVNLWHWMGFLQQSTPCHLPLPKVVSHREKSKSVTLQTHTKWGL